MSPAGIATRRPRPGDLVRLTEHASVQFAGARAVRLLVTGVDPRPTYEGWLWLTGYTVDDKGEAVESRQVFVQAAGLQWIKQDPG